MRDAIVFAIIFGSLPFIWKRPAFGVLMFTWISLMNPHRLTYGAAYDFPFAAVVAVFTALSLMVSKEPKRFPNTPVTAVLLIFTAWMTFTSFFALEPNLVWLEWNRVTKTMFMVVISLIALNTEKDIKRFTLVVVLSLGIFGLKGGIFTVLTGGSSRVFGPNGSYIAENNSMALALVTTLPLIWYVRTQMTNKWLTMFMTAMAGGSAIAAVGTYSRGALVGGAAMLFFLWCKSSKKIPTALAMIAIMVAIYLVMPEQWFSRMDTISEYKEDSSSMGRINAWRFAMNVAEHNLLGGGFNCFSQRMFFIYAPNPLDYHVAHSIYFQVLGDHGFFGLLLFLLLLIFAWRSGSRIIKFANGAPELKWATDLARMAQVSLVGYAVSGAFLSLAYFDLYYDILIILILLEKLLLRKSNGKIELVQNAGADHHSLHGRSVPPSTSTH